MEDGKWIEMHHGIILLTVSRRRSIPGILPFDRSSKLRSMLPLSVYLTCQGTSTARQTCTLCSDAAVPAGPS
eukprot:352068-Chlamydomonas_euryale.AAC.2